jgi:hypothetical protein
MVHLAFPATGAGLMPAELTLRQEREEHLRLRHLLKRRKA